MLADQFNAEHALRLVGVRQRSVGVVANLNAQPNEQLPHGLYGIGVGVNAAVTIWHGLTGVPTLPFTCVH